MTRPDKIIYHAESVPHLEAMQGDMEALLELYNLLNPELEILETGSDSDIYGKRLLVCPSPGKVVRCVALKDAYLTDPRAATICSADPFSVSFTLNDESPRLFEVRFDPLEVSRENTQGACYEGRFSMSLHGDTSMFELRPKLKVARPSQVEYLLGPYSFRHEF
jgi:hypothetical protein